ncbi:hypothetical protein ACHAQA_002476 [Verticillium albo-atrum]
MVKVFLTGASGYIGGDLLSQLRKRHPDYIIRALIRDQKVAGDLEEAGLGGNFHVVLGSLDDTDVVSREAAGADIILNLAQTGHLKSVEVIHEALSKRGKDGKPAHWIQISGASALSAAEIADKARVPGSGSDSVFDDLDGVADVRAIIEAHPGRAVDNYILDVARNTPQINTALVFPPIIYGKGRGRKDRSVQIPELVRATLQRKRGVQVGRGLSIWGNVHIHELSELFISLVEKAVDGHSETRHWNLDGVYLTGLREKSFGEISKLVAIAAKEKGRIPSDEVDEVLGDEANQVLPHGTILFGTNARSKARRGIDHLGWNPDAVKAPLVEEEIARLVETEAARL